MDFRLVLEKLVRAFDEQGVDYALIGGVALGMLGLPRATMDVDFLVNRKDLEKITRIMRDIGYEKRFSSENVSQYASPLEILGQVDFLHAFREAGLTMLENASVLPAFDGELNLKVVRPEDLIGLKLQALSNDPNRADQDSVDIRKLMVEYRDRLDWDSVYRYGKVFDLVGLVEQLRDQSDADA